MANIPVERKGGAPAWLWPLLILLLLVILFALFGPGCGDDEVDVVAPADTVGVVDVNPVEPTGELMLDGPVDIDNLDALFERLQSGTILGALVRLDDVVASDVTGDSTFYISSSDASQNLLVVLEDLGESQSNMGSADGRYSIQDGEELDVLGRITTLPANLRERFTMKAGASSEYYLRARRVDVTQGGPPSQR